MSSQPIKYILVIEGFKESLFATLDKLRKNLPEYVDTKYLLLTTQPSANFQDYTDIEVINTDFSPQGLQAIMSTHGTDVSAVICRGDKYVQYLRRLIPFLPPDVRVASERSLEITTNKRLMRQSFNEVYPEISPSFMTISDSSDDTLDSIERLVGFPAIIKPASLASSILIQKIEYKQQLKATIQETLSCIAKVYKDEGRSEMPELIVEEFLQGDFYSVDSYVMSKGDVSHLPPVGYLPAESMGIDDFFLYKRWTPADLSPEDIQRAQVAVEKAIQAAGLTWSSVHAELIKTRIGWKIIEIGPRIGRFRNTMYNASYGIDHEYNDLLIHLGRQPVLEGEPQQASIAYSIYPQNEGILKSIEGMELLEKYDFALQHKMMDNSRVGQHVKYAKNGGHALLEIVFSASQEDMLKISSEFEAKVKVVTS